MKFFTLITALLISVAVANPVADSQVGCKISGGVCIKIPQHGLWAGLTQAVFE